MIPGTAVCFFLILFLQMLSPIWWWIGVIPFLYGLFRARTFREGLVTGTGSAGLVWFCSSVYFYFTGSRIIAARTAGMFGLDVSWLMIGVTAVVAAAAGGAAGFTGYSLKNLFTSNS